MSGSGISWAICKSAPRSRQITMPASHHSVFYRPDVLPAAQPPASKHWRPNKINYQCWPKPLLCLSVCPSICPCCERKVAWASNTRVGRDIRVVHGRPYACIDPKNCSLSLWKTWSKSLHIWHSCYYKRKLLCFQLQRRWLSYSQVVHLLHFYTESTKFLL